jgi:hypothetical protein
MMVEQENEKNVKSAEMSDQTPKGQRTIRLSGTGAPLRKAHTQSVEIPRGSHGWKWHDWGNERAADR